ncbi:DUF5957 family protein [Thermocatellispora tengchongensis]|uniref:DUF5957 family protein n=1 Tax=Thermocatellispora tengchongensis TaxID=1073253 RepID=UPI0036280D65
MAAAIGGFIAGIVVSEVVAVVAHLGFGRAVGVRYLPVFTAVAGVGVALVAERRRRRRGSGDLKITSPDGR